MLTVGMLQGRGLVYGYRRMVGDIKGQGIGLRILVALGLPGNAEIMVICVMIVNSVLKYIVS